MKIQLPPMHYALLLATVLLVGCRTHGPAYTANGNAYMAKPVYRGENETALYFSGRLNNGYEYYPNEENKFGDLSAHAAFMSKNFFIAGGVFGYSGHYRVNPANTFNTTGGRQAFNGLGLRGEIGGRLPVQDKIELLLGLNGEFFRESGEYADNALDALSTIFTFGLSRTHINLAPAVDLRFVPDQHWNLGLRYSLDPYFTASDITKQGTNGYLNRLTLHATVDQFTAFGQIGFTPDKQRLYSIGAAIGIPFGKKKQEAKE